MTSRLLSILALITATALVGCGDDVLTVHNGGLMPEASAEASADDGSGATLADIDAPMAMSAE